MDLGVSGLASGFDWRTLVDQLVDTERLPQKRLRIEQSSLREQNNSYGSIFTQLSVLKNRVAALQSPDLFNSRMATVADPKVATASAGVGAVVGNFAFNFTQLATVSKQIGAAGAGKPLNASNDVSGLVLSNAGFAVNVTAGAFTVNGKQITVATSDTLKQVFDKVSTATGGTVTGTYNSTTDKISFASSSGEIVLGSTADSSNFLQVSKLNNNGGSTVTSDASLGSVKLAVALTSANLDTAITDGGAGNGKFKINGAEISFSSADSVATVLKRINDSSAGVTASYDSLNDRFILANKGTGDLGMALEDVTGNFLSATRLATGSIERGKDLLYTVNGGGQLRSHSNTITEASSGLVGLSVAALTEGGSTTVSVAGDTAKIRTAITDFIVEYNKTQSLIDVETASSTDAKGKVTAGTLASEGDAESIANSLRGLVYSSASGLDGVINHLDKLGIVSNGNDNTIKLSDGSKF